MRSVGFEVQNINQTVSYLQNIYMPAYARVKVFLPKPDRYFTGNSRRVVNQHKILYKPVPFPVIFCCLQRKRCEPTGIVIPSLRINLNVNSQLGTSAFN